jgi:hypothetical protein
MLWVIFVILLTAWLIALIAGGFGALIHSVITIYRSGAETLAVPAADAMHQPELRG